MKKLFLVCALSLLGLVVYAQDAFEKGEKRMNLTIGVGMVDYIGKSRAAFDQHFGMEWGVGKIADRVTVGVGFAVNNTYGGKYESKVAGKFDYKYTHYTTGKMYDFQKERWYNVNESKKIRREGAGTADADIAREDVNALATVSFHFTPIPKLDTYVKVGAGVGCMTYLIGNYRNEEGFKKANYNENRETKYTNVTTKFSYNDLDHVKWNGMDAKVVPSMAAYVGATYYLTETWGVEAQLGLISANIKNKKKGYPNSYGIFALGASYKF